MTKHQQHVNVPILASIPLQKDLKRYFRKMFEKMVENNGPVFACDKMKGLRETLMGYRADPNRSKQVETWMRRSGFRINGWLRQLFRYMDTQPEYTMQLVKMYCGPNDPVVAIGTAAEAQHRTLQRASEIRSRTPAFMQKWLHHICREKPWTPTTYLVWTTCPDLCPDWARNFVTKHSYKEYKDYLSRWKSNLWVTPISDEEAKTEMVRLEPVPEMYVDFGEGLRDIPGSSSLSEDIWNFLNMPDHIASYEVGDCGLSFESWSFVANQLNPMWMMAIDSDEMLMEYRPDKVSFLDGTYVGQIHHIPKKGTVKRRSIAAPNRVLQMGMGPVDKQLSATLKRLNGLNGRDCTYDQIRLNNRISQRVTNPNLYVGSVDLSQATDHLPFEWMKTIWSEVYQDRVSRYVGLSWQLFVEVAGGSWLNQGYLDHWTIGQPLGALPSFRCLGLTHNLLLESLCFTLGLAHSPYGVLGDDVVMFSKKLRKEYIKLMQNVGVPLSLHKSYEGNLVEFAGQLFIKNLAPFYTTDQRALTWESLFDYQLATGISIPLGMLPKRYRKRVVATMRDEGVPKGDCEAVYQSILWYMGPPRGSLLRQMPKGYPGDFLAWTERMAYLLAKEKNQPPAKDFFSGMSVLNGHPVTYLDYGYADKHGLKQRYVRTRTAAWYRDKYRPVATDKLIRCASRAFAQSDKGL